MADKVVVRSAYIPHDRVSLVCDPKLGVTRQEFANECDVNALMARYEKTGVWPGLLPQAEPRYFDCTDVPDFRTALDFVDEASRAFMSLPATVRREFDNDPVQFVEFAQDPKNLERMREWGLAAPVLEPDPPMRVEVVNSPEPGDKGATQ